MTGYFNAVLAGKAVFGSVTSFRLLPVGAIFRFAGARVSHGPEPIYMKSAAGTFVNAAGHVIATALNSAVVPLFDGPH